MNNSTANVKSWTKLHLIRTISLLDSNDLPSSSMSLSSSFIERCEIVADSHTLLFSTMCWKYHCAELPLESRRGRNEAACLKNGACEKTCHKTAKMQTAEPKQGYCPNSSDTSQRKHRTPSRHPRDMIVALMKRRLPHDKCRSLPFRCKTKTTRECTEQVYMEKAHFNKRRRIQCWS